MNEILYYEDRAVPGRWRLVVPTHLRRQVLLDNHETLFAGHSSPKKLLQKVNWPKMSESCAACLSTQVQQRRQRPPLQCILVGEPFECVGMDFKELNISHSDNRYALVFQDYLIEFPEVFPAVDRAARTVVAMVYQQRLYVIELWSFYLISFKILQHYWKFSSCQRQGDTLKQMVWLRG